jgi:hypothetical protein
LNDGLSASTADPWRGDAAVPMPLFKFDRSS